MKISTIICIIFFLLLLKIIYNQYRRNLQTLYKKSIMSNIQNLDKPEMKHVIESGKQYLSNSKIIITGTIRDGMPNVEHTIINLYKNIIPHFKDYRIMIVENDSKDNTRDVLIKYAKKDPKLMVLGCGINSPKCEMKLEATNMNKCPRCSTRINKMVKIRNIYQSEISKPQYSDFGLVLMIDFDLPGKIIGNGLFHTGYQFKTNPDIDGICAITFTDDYMYHDPYAHVEYKNHKIPKLLFHNTVIKKCVKGGMDRVSGCFNAFTIYRRNNIINKQYCTRVDKDNHAECEHDCFNDKLKNMYINYSMFYSTFPNFLDN